MSVGSIDASNGVWSAQPLVARTPAPVSAPIEPPGLNTGQLGSDRQSGQLPSAPPTPGGPPPADRAATASGGSPPVDRAATASGGPPPADILLAGPTSDRARDNLASLASALCTDASSLLARLSAGQGLRSLLSAGDGAYGPPPLNSSTGGIVIDQYA